MAIRTELDHQRKTYHVRVRRTIKAHVHPPRATSEKYDPTLKMRIVRWFLAISAACSIAAPATFLAIKNNPPIRESSVLCLKGIENDCWTKLKVPITFVDPKSGYRETASTFNHLRVVDMRINKDGTKSFYLGLAIPGDELLEWVSEEDIQFPVIYP